MSILYISLFVAVGLILAGSAVAVKVNTPIQAAAKGLNVACLVTLILTEIAMFHCSVGLSRIIYSLSLVGYNGVISMLLLFTIRYIDLKKYKKETLFAGSLLLLLDSLALLVNLFIPFVLTINTITLSDGRVVMAFAPLPYHRVHWCVSIAIVACCLVMLLGKSQRVPKMYRWQYFSIVGSILVVFLMNLLFVVFRAPMDISVLGFAVACTAIYYFSYYSPKRLIERVNGAVIRDLGDALLIFDYQGDCIYLNPAASKLFDATIYQKERIVQILKDIGKTWDLDWSEDFEREIVYESEGEGRLLRLQVHSLMEQKVVIGGFLIFHDYTEEERERQAEWYRSTHDELTDLYNRDAFYEEAADCLIENPMGEYMLVCSNIENFKILNDIFGITVGDNILRLCADLLRQGQKGGEVLGRLTDDRFVMLARKRDFDPNILKDRAARWFDDLNLNYPVRVYFGVYEVKDRGISVAGMCDRALMAMEASKGNSERVITWYDSSMWAAHLQEQEMIAELENAVNAHQFICFIQPQTNREGKVVGGEALIRWQHPEKGILPPGMFIPAAEKNSLIARLDRAVWEQACMHLRRWREQGIDMNLSVNISPKDFYYMDVRKVLTDLRNQYELAPGSLKVEITESAIMQDIDKQVRLIDDLRDAGFIVEIDDFGSGYSSLNMLRRINVDVLKVDMGFLANQGIKDERTRVILDFILELAEKLGISTIIEGVETREELEFLKEIGGSVFQGYYFAKPMAVSEFERRYLLEKKEEA